jgi:hypothetical protein
MKNIWPALLCGILLLGMPVKAQNAIGISFERGPGMIASDEYFSFLDYFFTLKKNNTTGTTLSYDKFYKFGGRSKISMGIGFNTTSFSQISIFRNLPKSDNTDPSEYKIGIFDNYFMALDFPFRYYLDFKITAKFHIAPYIGIKVRDIIYIGTEGDESGLSEERNIINGEDTVFRLSYELEYAMERSRLVVFPMAGLMVSRELVHGGRVALSADYNQWNIYSNSIRITYFDVRDTEHNVSYSDLEDLRMYRRLNMGHFKFGISYTWPADKKTR